MPTKAQIEARRANARLSQGPTTEAGKDASSRNATKFGFRTEQPLLPGEDPAPFLDFRQRLHASLQPLGEMEMRLANRVAAALWRLERFPTVEAGMFATALCKEQAKIALGEAKHRLYPEYPWNDERARRAGEVRDALDRHDDAMEEANSAENALGRIFMNDAQGGLTFARLTRYETAIERTMFRSLHELQRLQARRAGVLVPVPISIDVELNQNELVPNDLTEDLTPLDRAA